MSQLFKEGSVPPSGKALMRIIGEGIRLILEIERPDHISILDDVKGIRSSMESFVSRLMNYERPLVIVGAYPHGAFSDYIYAMTNDIVKIGDYSMDTSWTLCKLITSIESKLGLFA